MESIIYLLLLILIFVMVVNGIVLSLGVLVVEVTGSITLTQKVVWSLYAVAFTATVVLIWLCSRLGGRK